MNCVQGGPIGAPQVPCPAKLICKATGAPVPTLPAGCKYVEACKPGVYDQGDWGVKAITMEAAKSRVTSGNSCYTSVQCIEPTKAAKPTPPKDGCFVIDECNFQNPLERNLGIKADPIWGGGFIPDQGMPVCVQKTVCPTPSTLPKPSIAISPLPVTTIKPNVSPKPTGGVVILPAISPKVTIAISPLPVTTIKPNVSPKPTGGVVILPAISPKVTIVISPVPKETLVPTPNLEMKKLQDQVNALNKKLDAQSKELTQTNSLLKRMTDYLSKFFKF